MGNAVYTMLCLCTKEINQTLVVDDLPINGTHWHTISDSMQTDKITRSFHELVPNAVKIGSRNYYLICLLDWAKSSGYPTVNTAEDLEHLYLSLCDWEPNITNPDFEITKLFDDNADVYIGEFIQKLGFTPNDNVNLVLKYLVKNNKVYYNKIKYLEQIAQDVIDKKYTSIDVLEKYEQALLMTMVYKRTHTPFKLVHSAFNNTQDIWDSMEIENGKAV